MLEDNNNFKKNTITAILIILIACCCGYIFNQHRKAKLTQAEITKAENEKSDQIIKLTKLQNSYNTLLTLNSSYKIELEAQRDESMKLMEEIALCKDNGSILYKYKERVEELENQLRLLTIQNKELKKQNEILVNQRDSAKTALKKYQAVELNSNKIAGISNLNNVEKAKLPIILFKAATYKVRENGNRTPTDKAKAVNLFNIGFTIPENKTAHAGKRKYYIQVANADGKIIDEQTTNINGKELNYSIEAEVDYKNELFVVSEDLKVSGLTPGIYFVNAYYENESVLDTKIVLK